MLEKMGWKAGEGLGKSSAGITEPVGFDFLYMEHGLWGMEHGLWGMEHG